MAGVGLILFGILLCSLSTRIKDIHLNFDRKTPVELSSVVLVAVGWPRWLSDCVLLLSGLKSYICIIQVYIIYNHIISETDESKEAYSCY